MGWGVGGGGRARAVPPGAVGAGREEPPFPVAGVIPPYPPTALGEGLVLVEVTVGSDGKVTDARGVQAPAPFGPAALDAARKWRFRPACRQDRPAAATAYLVFGFRPPVMSPNTPG